MKKILIILILYLTSCGYQPIYLKKKLNNSEFNKITLNGNLEINRKIIKSVSIKKNESSLSNNELILESSYNLDGTSKNSKGEVTSYRSTVTVNLIIQNNNEKIKSKSFIKDFSYNTTNNKFDLVKYQKEIKNNLVNEIIKDIIIYISLE